MSKKGRSSVVLLGSLVVCLLLMPLVYLAFGTKLDRIALNKRIALLESATVTSPAALQSRYRAAREHLLQILPPDPDYKLNPSGGLVVFDPANFSWATALEAAELNGVTVYPVTVTEDPETRYTAFYNGSAELIGYLAPEQDYFPFTWLADRHPEYYAENADPYALAWAEAIYDPARVSVTYYLLPSDSVEAMAKAQLAAVQQPEFEMNMMMGEGLPEPVTNLVIFAIEKATNGIALGIGWPDDFTNKLEVFARSTIATTGWFVASSNLSTAGTNSLWWTDTSLTTSVVTRFYRVGNADQDIDSDGLTDARERFMYGTDEELTDTDGDGLSDLAEAQTYYTDPLNPDTDNDGLNDGDEITPYGTDPLDPDSDNDGLLDGDEAHTCRRFSHSVDPASSSWVNLSTNGTSLRGLLANNDEDDGAATVSLGFPFPFYGTNYGEAEIGVNGLIEFGDAKDGLSPWENEALPSLPPFPMIAAFWYDLCVFPENADILWATMPSGTSSVFVVEWRDVAIQYDPDNTHMTFQAVLEPSGIVRVNYQTLTGPDTDGSFATFGVQSAGGSACQYAYAEPGCVYTGLSLVYTPQREYTDPCDSDTDDDGMSDGWEVLYNLKPLDASDAPEDADIDGLTNLQEYQLHTDPRDFDTDHDGMADGWEVTYDFDPLDPSDAAEDADNDGLTNLQEYQHDSDPQVPDTDTDGVEDGDEALRDRTDPTNPDRTPPAIHLITPVNGSRKVVVP